MASPTTPMPMPRGYAGGQPSSPQPEGAGPLMEDRQQGGADNGNAQRQRQAMLQVQQIDTALQDFSRQYPEFAPHAKKIQDELKQGMVKVIQGMQRATEVSAPNLVS